MRPHVSVTTKIYVTPCGNVPGSGRGRVAQVKVHVQIPQVVVERIEELIRSDGSANSVPDFVRQAAVKELERRRGGTPVPDEGARETVRRVRTT